MRILLVEDHAKLAGLLRNGLREEGITADVAGNRPTLGLFPGTTREAAGFDGARTMVGPRSQDLFVPGSSQDLGFVGAVRIPTGGGNGKALILCVNKNDVEAAVGVGFDYASSRFFFTYTQAFNGAPSEVAGPVVARGATYVLRLQKAGGAIRLYVDGVLAAQTSTARPAILANGQGAAITLGGLRPLNPQFVGQLGKFYLRQSTLSDTAALLLEADVETWLGTN